MSTTQNSTADIGAGFGFRALVEKATIAAMLSPCQSKRGVIIFDASFGVISRGANDQPYPFSCDSSSLCKKNCGKTAVHAEQDAILKAGRLARGALMIHVKAQDGKPCASMHPSCLECSKLILRSGIEWMHLLADPRAQLLPGSETVAIVEGFKSDGSIGQLDVRRYRSANFHWLTAEYFHHIKLLASEAR